MAVVAAMALGWAGTAWAPPGGIPTCQSRLNTCTASLSTCRTDLDACKAAATPFPATGQTTAFQADKNDGITGPVAVPDDGTEEAGATLNYTDNDDGTITDHNTGLMWEKKSDDGGLHDKDNVVYTWSGDGSQETIWDWLEDVNAESGIGFAGFNDWRLPNIKELQSIVNYGTSTRRCRARSTRAVIPATR